MKIDILQKPPDNIYKNRSMYTLIFGLLLVLAACGLLLGAYAIVAETKYYETLETAALFLFVAPSLLVSYIGGKLQGYKRLTPPEQEELAELGRKHPEIKAYTDLVAKDNRRPIRAEYEACRNWEEKESRPVKET